jgi:hypothetical protein
MAVVRPVPASVRKLAQRWIAAGKPAQPPTPWPRDRWIKEFPAQRAVLEQMPDWLDRGAVAAACSSAAESPQAAGAAFLAVMAWGFGSVGFGRFRTARILNSRADATERLQEVARITREDEAIAAYRALGSDGIGRLPFLGPAFGTKFLYFCQPTDRRPRALILDAFVGSWLAREASWRLDTVQWSAKTYGEYLETLHAWAEELGLAPDDLELCIFQAEAELRGSQWAVPSQGVSRTAPTNDAVFDLPFEAYPQGGRTLLGKPKSGDGTARRSYGVKALEWCAYRCAYCGLDMSTFEGWLQLSIDHVIPQQMQGAGYPMEWVLDAINVVAACLACNGYFNRDPVIGDVPTSLEAFCEIRDRVFRERRARIVQRRAMEHAWFDSNILPSGGRK